MTEKFILDTDILLNAYLAKMPYHKQVSEWLENTINGGHSILLTVPVMTNFFEITTSEKMMENVFSVKEVLEIFTELFRYPTIDIFQSSKTHFMDLWKFLEDRRSFDSESLEKADLAVAALSSGATITTCDKKFPRIPFVKIFNPLE